MFIPTQFGQYLLSERIGMGGMAEIYKAKLLGVGGFERPMAVKQILPQYASDPDFIEMFIDEAKIAVKLQHGNIVGVHELGRIDETYFIAMEYVHGRNLSEIASAASKRSLPLSVEHAVLIGIEICKGLDYAHRRTDELGHPLGVVHRDLSPSNVMVSFDGAVKITDFGIAKARHKLGKTAIGAVKGTYGYMSPEQLVGKPVDNRTDIFSTGILLFELLTGQQLFPGSTDLEAVERAREARVTPPSLVSERVPPGLDMIVLRALERHAEDRYPDANAMQLALSRFLFTSGRGASSATLGAYMRELFPPGEDADVNSASTRLEVPELGPGGLQRRAQARVPELTPGPDRDLRAPRPEGRGLSPTGTRSYAVRAELAQAAASSAGEAPGAHGAVRAVVAVKGVAAEETLALPSLEAASGGGVAGSAAAGEGPAATDGAAAFAAALFAAPRHPAAADERGGVAPGGDRPHGDVGWSDPFPGALGAGRRRTASFTPPAVPVAQVAHRGPPELGSGEWAGPEGGAAKPVARAAPGLPSPAERVEEKLEGKVEGKVEPRPPRSDASVMALLVQPEAVARTPAPVLPDADFSSSGARAATPSASWSSLPFPPPEAEVVAGRAGFVAGAEELVAGAPARRNLLSATMQLFVQNFGELEPIDTRQRNEARASQAVRLTLLSWVLIGLIVATAVAFLVYRKTRLVGSELDEGTAMLSGDDLRQTPAQPTPATAAARRGAIALTVDPTDAVVLLHVGDTPTTVADLELGRAHLLRLEREGYSTVERIVTPAELATGQPIAIPLQLVGAGADPAAVGTVPGGARGGRRASLTVSSDPPGATLWLAVGRGAVDLPDLPVGRYYFKVMRAGYQVAFISLSEGQFEAGDGTAREAVSLVPLAGTAAVAAPPEAPVATPAATPAASEAPVTAPSPRATLERRRASSASPRRPSAEARRPEPRPVQPKQPAPARRKLTLPSWAN